MSTLSQEAALVHEALLARGLETPLRAPTRDLDDETRKSLIAGHMTEIMQLLNLDLQDDSLIETRTALPKCMLMRCSPVSTTPTSRKSPSLRIK